MELRSFVGKKKLNIPLIFPSITPKNLHYFGPELQSYMCSSYGSAVQLRDELSSFILGTANRTPSLSEMAAGVDIIAPLA